MSKPSLAEIAAMPMPASVFAMREHYNPEWALPVPDGATKRKFKLQVQYSYTGSDVEIVDIEAFTREEAEEKASEAVGRDYDDAEIDIDFIKVVSEAAA